MQEKNKRDGGEAWDAVHGSPFDGPDVARGTYANDEPISSLIRTRAASLGLVAPSVYADGVAGGQREALSRGKLSDTAIPWRELVLGAFVTAVPLGKSLVGIYLGRAAPSRPLWRRCGVLMFWTYYSAQIFLFAAELTKAIADERATGGPPGSRRNHPTQREFVLNNPIG